MKLLGFLARHFSWVPRVMPWAPGVFDGLLMLFALLITPRRFLVQERLWNQILDLPGVSETAHRFGGREAVLQDRELCHIHGNGVLDFILPNGIHVPEALASHIHPHHVYPDSRWRTLVVTAMLPARCVVELLDSIANHRRNIQHPGE